MNSKFSVPPLQGRLHNFNNDSGVCCFFVCMLVLLAACRKDPVALRTWQEQKMPVSMNINSIWFTDSLQGFAAGGISWTNGCLLSTTDGGNSWTTDTIIDAYSVDCIMSDSGGRVYAVGQSGRCYERPPGQKLWTIYREDYRWHHSCFVRDGKKAVIVSGESFGGGEIRTCGPDYFWFLDTTQLFPNQLQAVWSSSPGIWHVCGMGWVMRSTDDGYTWTRLDNTGDFFVSMHFPTPSTGYIVGSSGTILKTVDEGSSWQEIRKGGTVKPRRRPFRSVWFTTENDGWIVGDGGLFWHTADGGNSWQEVREVPGDVHFTDVFVSGGRGWVSGEGGRMFYFEE